MADQSPGTAHSVSFWRLFFANLLANLLVSAAILCVVAAAWLEVKRRDTLAASEMFQERLAISTTSSSSLNGRQREAAYRAIQATRKVQAVVGVGLALPEYTSRMLDAVAETDRHLQLVPAGPAKTAIQKSVQAYADAGRLWSSSITAKTLIEFIADNDSLLSKYNIPHRLNRESAGFSLGSDFNQKDREFVLQKVWSAADAELMKATQLVLPISVDDFRP